MLDGCSTHTIIQEKILPWLKTKFIASSALIVENLHGEEEYPISLMEVELPQNGSNTVIIKAYAINKKFPVMKDEILQNSYEGETHIIIGQDNCWTVIDNSSGLENFISHKTNKSGILRTKFCWSASGNL